jgi:hypothetical protein
MGKAANKVPVSTRALIQRINRALAHEGEQLKTTRGERWRGELGNFYIIDTYRNGIEAQHVDPEELGREMKVLQPYEVVLDG